METIRRWKLISYDMSLEGTELHTFLCDPKIVWNWMYRECTNFHQMLQLANCNLKKHI